MAGITSPSNSNYGNSLGYDNFGSSSTGGGSNARMDAIMEGSKEDQIKYAGKGREARAASMAKTVGESYR